MTQSPDQITKEMIERMQTALGREGVYVGNKTVERALTAALQSAADTPAPSSHLRGDSVFPSKEEIRHIAKLALEEMQREATTDPAAWIASYERVIMAYRRLALSKQQASDSEAWERANEAVKAANALQVEVDQFRALYPEPQPNLVRSEAEELAEINEALKTIQSTCLQLQYDHSGRYGVETIEPLRNVARLINKLVWEQAPAPQPNLLGRVLAYLEGSDPKSTSGGERNSDLRKAVRAALEGSK